MVLHVGVLHKLDFVFLINIFETSLDDVPIFILGFGFLDTLVVGVVQLGCIGHVEGILLIIVQE